MATESFGIFFESQNKDVITFVGDSGAEYEDKTAMLEKAGRILEEFDSSKTIVNIGATPEGIGAVCELAKRRGFTTTGIIKKRARWHRKKDCPHQRISAVLPVRYSISTGKLVPNPGKPELKIEYLLYRFALSFEFKSIAFLSEPASST